MKAETLSLSIYLSIYPWKITLRRNTADIVCALFFAHGLIPFLEVGFVYVFFSTRFLFFFFFFHGIIAVSSLDNHQLHTPRWLISTIPIPIPIPTPIPTPIPIPTPVPDKSPPPASENHYELHPALHGIPTSDEEKIERRAPSDTRNFYDEWSQRLVC